MIDRIHRRALNYNKRIHVEDIQQFPITHHRSYRYTFTRSMKLGENVNGMKENMAIEHEIFKGSNYNHDARIIKIIGTMGE